MRNFIFAMLVLSGCQPPFDITDYIEDTCDGTADRTMLIHGQCMDVEMEVITDAIEYANEELGVETQICGVVWGTTEEIKTMGSVIACDLGVGGSTVGWWSGNDITLWVLKMKGAGHLRKVMLHELGHLIARNGKHSGDSLDIMCQGWFGVTEYTETDKEIILHAYL